MNAVLCLEPIENNNVIDLDARREVIASHKLGNEIEEGREILDAAKLARCRGREVLRKLARRKMVEIAAFLAEYGVVQGEPETLPGWLLSQLLASLVVVEGVTVDMGRIRELERDEARRYPESARACERAAHVSEMCSKAIVILRALRIAWVRETGAKVVRLDRWGWR